jgi:electron transfer flavoprotein alpha subunit
MTAEKNILVVTESAAGNLPPATYELLTLARRLRAATGGDLGVVLLDEGDFDGTQALAEYGVDVIYRAQCVDFASLTSEIRLPIIQAACEQAQPVVVLLPHDVLGAELGPRLAYRLDAGAATGCVDVVVDVGSIRCTRPCYGGLAREEHQFERGPVIATVRAGLFERAQPQPGMQAAVVELPAFDPSAARVQLVKRESDASVGPRLEDAKIIVAGGRGLDGPEGFKVLQDLAAELGAAVGSSRVPCDLGWCPHSWQIGLTGKTVTPELYIAVGISGAGHHMAGCGNAKTIVAINSDPAAAIFQDARFGVVGDYREVVPALAAQVRRLKQA